MSNSRTGKYDKLAEKLVKDMKKKEKKKRKKAKKKKENEELIDVLDEAIARDKAEHLRPIPAKIKDLKMFVYRSGDGYVDSIYKNTGNPDDIQKVPMLYIRLDNALTTPLSIEMGEGAIFLVINNEYQVNFVDGVGEDAFLNDLFFFLEEIHQVPEAQRSTTPRKDIILEEELATLKDRHNKQQKSN